MQQQEVNEIYWLGVEQALRLWGPRTSRSIEEVIQDIKDRKALTPPTLEEIAEARGSFEQEI